MKIKRLLVIGSLLMSISLTSCNRPRTYYGEYTEKSGSYNYTTKVNVMTEKGIITKVEFVKGSNHHTDISVWPDASKWIEKESEILKSFEGKSVKEVRNSTSNKYYDNVAGATLTSNRIYKAVVAALNN